MVSFDILFIYGSLLAGMTYGVKMLYEGFHRKQGQMLVKNTATSKIRSLAMGRVEIKGSAHPKNEHVEVAPFSKRRVAYCRWTIEKKYVDRHKREKWKIIRESTIGKYFKVKDDTAEVLVYTKDAEMDVALNYDSQSMTLSKEEFLDKINVKYKRFLGGKETFRFREYAITEFEHVYVLGNAADNPFIENETSDANHKDIMIQKGRDELFYISNKTEKQILFDFFWKSWAKLILASILILGCMALLIIAEGVW